jgi:hypothetical protein
MTDKPSADKLVSAYRNLRDAIRAKEAEHEKDVAGLKEQLELISDELIKLCNEHDMDSIRTVSGTVSRRVQTRFWTDDWGQMYNFAKEHDALHLFQKRLHTENMKQFLEENPDLLPAGLQTERKYVVSVRKPAAK